MRERRRRVGLSGLGLAGRRVDKGARRAPLFGALTRAADVLAGRQGFAVDAGFGGARGVAGGADVELARGAGAVVVEGARLVRIGDQGFLAIGVDVFVARVDVGGRGRGVVAARGGGGIAVAGNRDGGGGFAGGFSDDGRAHGGR